MKYNIPNMVELIQKGNSDLSEFDLSTIKLLLNSLNNLDNIYYSGFSKNIQSIIDLLIKDEWIQINNDRIVFHDKLNQFVF